MEFGSAFHIILFICHVGRRQNKSRQPTAKKKVNSLQPATKRRSRPSTVKVKNKEKRKDGGCYGFGGSFMNPLLVLIRAVIMADISFVSASQALYAAALI
jgi:hypothetical protein